MENLGDLIVPKFLDAALTPVAKEAGDRLVDVINLVFTPIIMARKYRDIKVNLFFDEVENRLKKIPENNVVNPPLNIVGPALDSVAKFYYEEKHLRELFAHLIAASMNKDILPEVHPAFVEVIKQLDFNDVTILNSNYLFEVEDNDDDEEIKCLYSVCYRPVCDIVYRSKSTGEIVGYITKNFVFAKNYFNKMSLQNFSLSLQNLVRLNIVTIEENLLYLDSFYEDYLDQRFWDYNNLCKEDSIYNSKDVEVSLVKKVITLTDFGQRFVKTCVS
ncbi:DUF4393 domain-containing protein [Desulfosporosinus nitroreducens]|uniref:DUF4393 domain-containing protein n=1 Tax=Desulfosporosinus nitroreducens TaxID=2018668 RepID=UPI00207C569D|nr:DUF4393 domain-containing protein [Desulfosporosinus nitroreducens]MCO1599741.1 DUF4393 domain-containing protein [Desulfosporosinus nitroreducens]